MAMMLGITLFPALAHGADTTPVYKTLDELAGKNFAYVNGSVYTKNIEERLEGTSEQFYPSLAECVAAVEAGKADAAVQLSYCCEYAINQRPGTVTLMPEPVAHVSEAFFFPRGSKLTEQFNNVIRKFSEDGTLEKVEKEWVAADESGKTLPEQDWEAPNGTLRFATPGVLQPFSYVGNGGRVVGYDVELALLIARELGYHLEVSAIPMDSILAAVDTGKVDFGGTLTNTPERASVCDFSEKVMPATISVIVETEEADSSAGFIGRIKDSFKKTFIVEDRWKLIISGLRSERAHV